MRPAAYVSRSLTPAEKKYPTHKLEFFVLKWVVMDKLKDYLYGADFVVKNDNNLLAFVLTIAKLNATRHTVGGWPPAVSPMGREQRCQCPV